MTPSPRRTVLHRRHQCYAHMPGDDQLAHVLWGSIASILQACPSMSFSCTRYQELSVHAIDGLSRSMTFPSARLFLKSRNGRRRTLDVDDVADAIVTELRRAHRTRRVVVLPAIFYLMPLYQLLPMPIKVYMCCCWRPGQHKRRVGYGLLWINQKIQQIVKKTLKAKLIGSHRHLQGTRC